MSCPADASLAKVHVVYKSSRGRWCVHRREEAATNRNLACTEAAVELPHLLPWGKVTDGGFTAFPNITVRLQAPSPPPRARYR